MSTAGQAAQPPAASVIVPAHNEERVIARLLDALVGPDPEAFEVIVVCNGCNDGTAEVASAYGGRVRVIEIEEASKRKALRRGNGEATTFPRLLVDADVQLGADSARRLIEAVQDGPQLASAPRRSVPLSGANRFVRWYYDVWLRLPQVVDGLFGRGVIALSEAGSERVQGLPEVMGDDLAASEAFEPAERVIVNEATVVIWPPTNLRDLHRRRVRAATGNAQADRVGLRRKSSVTSLSALTRLARTEPRIILRFPIFIGVTAAAQLAARRAIRAGDYDTWLRDDSSRR